MDRDPNKVNRHEYITLIEIVKQLGYNSNDNDHENDTNSFINEAIVNNKIKYKNDNNCNIYYVYLCWNQLSKWKQLKGSLPQIIGTLVHLKELYLNHNILLSLPTSINNLVNLNILSISNNQIAGSIPSLSKLIHLQRLDLSNNKLSSISSSLLHDMISLEILDLSNNNIIYTLNNNDIGNLKNLKRFNISNNQISGIYHYNHHHHHHYYYYHYYYY
jgi:Leucine-rich repeat (LRR) protein